MACLEPDHQSGLSPGAAGSVNDMIDNDPFSVRLRHELKGTIDVAEGTERPMPLGQMISGSMRTRLQNGAVKL